jgi:hypothetical protein
MKYFRLFALLLFATPVFAQQTYYVSISSGADTNSSTAAQSKSSPWAHLPGMATCTSNCASYTPQPGDSFILKGCDDWPNASFPLTWTWSGTSGSHITLTVDQTWYNTSTCPSAWNRPIFDAGQAVIDPPECTTSNSNGHLNTFVNFVTSQYIDWNWLEETNHYLDSAQCFGSEYYNKGGDFITLNNFYTHGAYAGAAPFSSCGSNCFDSEVWEPANDDNNTLMDHLVDDNSDGQAGSPGLSFGNVGSQLTNSVIQYVSNGLRVVNYGIFANNNINHLGGGLHGNHPNCIETLGPGSGSYTYYIYNNYIHDNTGSTYGCNTAWGNPGETDYVWNNILSNTLNTPNGPQGAGWTAVYMWNNSWAIGGGTCFQENNNPTVAFVAQNNHCMTGTTPNGSAQSGGWINGTVTGTPTITIDHNSTETQAQANAQGYSIGSTYAWQPTSSNCSGISTNCPIGVGVNLTSEATGLISSLGLDTTYACTEQTVSGVVQSVCPARTALTRPTSGAWDEDAYQYSSSGVTTLSPTSQAFGSQGVGTTGSGFPFTLSNASGVTVTGITPTFVGGNSSDWVNLGTGTCGSSLTNGSSCTFNLAFHPTVAGSRTTTFNVADSDSTSPQQSTLTGTGVAFNKASAPGMFADIFGDFEAGLLDSEGN